MGWTAVLSRKFKWMARRVADVKSWRTAKSKTSPEAPMNRRTFLQAASMTGLAAERLPRLSATANLQAYDAQRSRSGHSGQESPSKYFSRTTGRNPSTRFR